ncbi:hypothetical protein ACWFNE_12130 [Cellulomonas sp. NPDC055163]
MADQSETHRERVNEELREYEGFPAVLDLLRRAADRPADEPSPQHAGREQAVARSATLGAEPELAELVRRIDELRARGRAEAWAVLFGSPRTDDTAQE